MVRTALIGAAAIAVGFRVDKCHETLCNLSDECK